MSVDSLGDLGEDVDMKPCTKVEPPHPCDTPLPCDPFFQESECPTPFICQERLKNPAWPGEVTRCKTGSYMHVKSCTKVEPPHPCDKLPGCSLKSDYEKNKKLQCKNPPLCIERIKNPANRKKKDPSCDANK